MSTNVKSPEPPEAKTTDGAVAHQILSAIADAGAKTGQRVETWQPNQKWVASWRFCQH